MTKLFFSLCFLLASAVGFNAQSLSEVVNDPKTILVDVRSREEFAEGNVKNSINIPIDELESRLGELDKDKNIVVFCKLGIRAGKAEKLLKEKGFKHIHNGKTWQDVNALVKDKPSKTKKKEQCHKNSGN